MPGPTPSGPTPSPAPAQPTNPWPWIIGGCGCLLVIGIIASIVIALAFVSYKKSPAIPVTTSAPLHVEKDTAPLPPLPVPPTWTNYVSTRAAVPTKLRPHFVGFTFSYPADRFAVAADEDNFIKVEHNLTDDPQHPFTLENLAVGYITGTAGLTSQQDQDALYPKLLQQLSSQFAVTLPNYKELATITDHVAGQRARTLLFQAELKGSVKGDIQIYGKAIVVRQTGQERGVAIIMLATSLVPGITGPADVGVKGDLGPMLGSFKFTE